VQSIIRNEPLYIFERMSDSREASARYATLLGQAERYKENEEHRAAADKFMEAVLAAPSPSAKHRFCSFIIRFDILRFNSIWSKKDMRILKKRFVDNDKEPVIYRVLACIHIGFARAEIEKDYVKATNKLDRALELIAQSPREDDYKVIMHHPFMVEGKNTVKEELEIAKSAVKKLFNEFRGDSLTPEETQEIRDIHSFFFGSLNTDCVHGEGSRCVPCRCRYASLIRKPHKAAGSCCDYCNKTGQEGDLMKRAICKLAFIARKSARQSSGKRGTKWPVASAVRLCQTTL
jgi:hypothetical protein